METISGVIKPCYSEERMEKSLKKKNLILSDNIFTFHLYQCYFPLIVINES